MSRMPLVARRSIRAILAGAVIAAGLLFAPASSFAAAPSQPATRGFRIFVKSADAAQADATRFLQTLPTDGALADWRGAIVSQSIPVQGSDGSVVVYVVTLTTGGGYAGYVTIDALPSANPVLEFSRNPAPVFASDTVAQTQVGVAKDSPRVKRQVYLGPLAYAVETVATTGATETLPTGALMHASSTHAIRGPPAVGSFGSIAPAGSAAVTSLGSSYKLIANMPDYDQFTYNYTSSEYNSGTTPAATGVYAASPYLNAGSYASGCAPNAASDVIGYWALTYPKLLTGKTPTRGGTAWQKLVNDLHVYFHTENIGGSGSTYGNEVAPGLTRYAQAIGGYTFDSIDVSDFSWAAYTAEIDAKRPVVLMFQNLNVTAPNAFPYGSHAITGIGYDHTPGTIASEYMIVHDNWPGAPSDVYVQFSGPNATYDSREMVTLAPAAAVPPANDGFASAQTLSGPGGSVVGTSVNASKEAGEPDHANNAGGASIWYRWTASATGTLTVDTLGSAYDTLLAAYTGTSVSALTAVASNDDFGSVPQSKIAFHVSAGTTYRIAVDGSAGASGGVSLNWAFAAGSVAPDTVTATIDTPASGAVAQGVPVSFSGHATDSLGHAVSGYEWTSGADVSISAAASFSTTALSPGTHTIGFRAMCANGTWSARETVTLLVTGSASAPANDAFDAAPALTASSGTTSGTNVSATKETGEPNHAGNSGGASVWYLWVAPGNGSLSVDTSGSGFDTVLAVYTGTSVAALTGKASGDAAAAGDHVSRVTVGVVAGTTYRVAVDGHGGASGAVTVNWSFRAPVSSSSTVHLSASSIIRYRYVTIGGTLRPARAGATVLVEVLKPGSHRWVRLVTRTTDAAGGWAPYRYKFTLRGTYHVRTRSASDASHLASTSGYAHLRVR